LRPFHQIFIVEMGAKQPGDIAEICRLVHPKIGILTAVGESHLESFGSIENVQKTKFELIDALPADGVAILNNDFEMIANRPVTNVQRVFRYSGGARSDADGGTRDDTVGDDKKSAVDFSLADIAYSPFETTFRIKNPQNTVTESFTTHLAGVHNLSNVLAGYIAGRSLGMTDDEMRYAVSRIEQVEHRLSIRQLAGGLTIIDDAFNSNPHGAAMALDVLKNLGRNSGGGPQIAPKPRIVVTPGMVELGAKQEQYNREFGLRMASACDFAIVVGEYNRAAIVAGFEQGLAEIEAKTATAGAENTPAAPQIFPVATFAEATQKVRELTKNGAVVLYENDLPDTFK
jgi:UDP-N-acetylmuramoyl-tripeptide--D-alanyl-D-alanine ligase